MTEVCKEGEFDIVLVAVPTDTPAPDVPEADSGEETELLQNNNTGD